MRPYLVRATGGGAQDYFTMLDHAEQGTRGGGAMLGIAAQKFLLFDAFACPSMHSCSCCCEAKGCCASQTRLVCLTVFFVDPGSPTQGAHAGVRSGCQRGCR